MAELDEEIVIVYDSDADSLHKEESSNSNKKLIIVAILTSLIIIGVILFFIFSPSEKKVQNISMDEIENKLDKEPKKVIKVTELEKMIAKANYLYSTGSKNKALSLYKKIALFSEAISSYNLGVAQLKNKQYSLALKTFKKAIQNDEKRCVSAINAAVCSLHLNDKTSFKYYIDLAHAYLAKEKNTKLYSYYYSLINYYNKNYIEVLSSLKHPSSDEYIKIQNDLSAKINAMFANDYKAIESLEENLKYSDDFSLGILYARVGDLSLAKKYLESSIDKDLELMKAQLALALINLKSGLISKAAKLISNVTRKYEEEVYKPYPIRVYLKEAIFNPAKAQKRYRKLIKNSQTIDYQKIFYFSPYKIFNANQMISYIRKGNANIFIDNVDSAKDYLKKGSSSSNVNVGIIKAIEKALNLRTRDANIMLQKLIKIQPKHPILQYNLALSYAQMGDMVKAQKHFLRSYHLDAKNYLSGIYAIMCSQLIKKDYQKLLSIINESIDTEQDSEEITLYKTLLHVVKNNTLAMVDWLDNNYKQRPLYLALDVIISLKLNKIDIAKRSVNKLVAIQKKDILPHMMYIDANFADLNNIEYAREVQNYLKVQKLKFDDLYFGPYITRYLYIQQNLIIGKLYYLRQEIKKVLETTQENTQDLNSALALASLYDGEFEESYSLYNNLIDNLKVRDAHTLFLASVASIAASHHANAIALLELSKLKNPNFLEARYALGLLYLEVKNNKGAVIQLSKIGPASFNSGFFNFNIDLDELTYKKMHPNE
jgi:Tfp pilus assembly protein PilF